MCSDGTRGMPVLNLKAKLTAFPLIFGRLYTGTVVHRLCQELKTSSTIENLLSTSPKMYQLYSNLVHVVKDYLSPDVIQKKKSRSKKKAHKGLKKDAKQEALPSCSINRFAPFMVED